MARSPSRRTTCCVRQKASPGPTSWSVDVSSTAAVDLACPDAFVDGPPHEALAVLRRTDPVHWQPMADEPGFWAVLRHADVAHVARHTEIFSASEGGITVEDMPAKQLAMMRNMLLAMDPPVHTRH